MASWTDTTDPGDSWSDDSHKSYRHTYGAEYGETTRIRLGDNVRIGGSSIGWADTTDPSDSWTDE